MAQRSLGVVTPGAAGPVRATAGQTDPTLPVWAHSYRVFQWPGNTGKGYVGSPNLDVATGFDCFGWVPELTATLAQFYESEAVESQQDPVDLSQIYIDADVATDNFLITYMEA